MSVTVRQKIKGRNKPWHVFIHKDGIIRSKKIGDKRTAEAVAAKLRKKLSHGQLNIAPEKTPSLQMRIAAKIKQLVERIFHV